MNKTFKYPMLFVLTCFAALFTACSDWTDSSSIDIKESDIEKDNPELYQKYLANLRNYRDTEHKFTYVWFDNIAGIPNSRGQRINALPDSVDVVNLMNPDQLSSYVMEDMAMAQRDKGMKFVLTVSYPEIEKLYELYQLQKPETDPVDDEDAVVDEFLVFSKNYVDEKLALVDKYSYDGVSVLFYGMKTIHLPEADKEIYYAREATFMEAISAWITANPTKTFIFEGYPQNLTDKSVLQVAKFIVVRTELLKYAEPLDFEVSLVIEEGVPTDRFVVAVNARSFEDEKVGYYNDAMNELVPCIPVAARWVDTYSSKFTKAGLGIINAQNEYYNSGNSYQTIREAIGTMNFSPKI